MPRTKSSNSQKKQRILEFETNTPTPPPFEKLLSNPLVKDPLPSDFNSHEESEHLITLWKEIPGLRTFNIEQFIHAGGSGMVFKARRISTNTIQALKVARKKLLSTENLPDGAAKTLSPVSERELKALEKISHPNVVRLYDAIGDGKCIVGISTSFVDDPKPLDVYLRSTLEKVPQGSTHAFSPERLDRACSFLIERCLEIAQAIAHMQSQGVFHFDIKPANILISSQRIAILTDLGACIHTTDIQENKKLRAQFTWTYAHPDLRSMIHQPASISGGGLKASAEIAVKEELQKYDLFAFGRTLQEALAILASDFGERAYASYGFRYLHLIASLCLDGHNAPGRDNERLQDKDGRKFVTDAASDYPVSLFSIHKITSAEELVERLKRFSREYSWNAKVPELDISCTNRINTGIGEPAPFTDRVAHLLNHPALRRLKFETQLGWIVEVYPGATHNRWSHTIGVLSAVVRYYGSLFSDPEIPTLRVLLNPSDLEHTMVAAILHDVGQVSFGHDLEAACPGLFRHEDMIRRLLDEPGWGSTTLRMAIKNSWPNVSCDRVLEILSRENKIRPIDGIAQDIIDGPIDADKFDYVQRDSTACSVPYGKGIDTQRFMQAIAVDAKALSGGNCRLMLAYKAKGLAAIEAILLARYQMYGAVYWHHTFRCIQAMFSHAAATTFTNVSTKKIKIRSSYVNDEIIKELIFHWLVCGKAINATEDALIKKGLKMPIEFKAEAPLILSGERALEFVWKFAPDGVRTLIERLGSRELYKRVLEIKVSDLGELGDYSALCSDLEPRNRPELSKKIESNFLNAIYKAITSRSGVTETDSESMARQRFQELSRNHGIPRVVIDFPTRGVPEEINFPPELGDSARKYTGAKTPVASRGKVFKVVKELQTHRAALRIFVAKEFHELIVRYLDPATVEDCVAEIIPRIRS